MRNRLAVAISAPLAVTLAVSLSACASSGSTVSGQGANASGGSSGSQNAGSSSSSSTPSTSASSSSSPSLSLAAKLGQGLSQARTAHLTLDVNAAGHDITGQGDEQLSNGKLVALDLTETVAKSVSLRLILVNGKAYIRLPSALSHSSKPWALATTTSSNPTVAAFAKTLASTQSSASLSSVTAFVSAARSVKQVSTNGSGTTYSVDVDPSKLPGTYEGKQALQATGLSSIPITIRLDSSGRPTLVTDKLTVEGQTVSSTVTVSSYNKPVHISAPPASQTSTG